MVHRGKRSEEAENRRREIREKRRELRTLIFTTSFRDREMSETVCRMHVHFEGLITDLGDVLLDSRGRGTFQTVGGDLTK